jgi:tRNA U55 pseudouridine synthase TruB
MQTPPAYSAVKVNGRRLYAYARAGETVQAPARKIYIKEITVESIDLEAGSVVFQVTCSKGSYIRALCADIGKALGCGAVMSGLLRTASGCFTLAASHTAETLTRVFSSASGAPDAGGDLPEAVRAVCVRMDEALGVFAPLCLPEADCVRFVNGLPVRAPALFSASAATAAPAETAASAETPVPAKTAASAETPARSVPGAAYGPAEKCKDRYRVYGAPGGLHAGFLGIGKREDALLRAEKVLWGQDGLL